MMSAAALQADAVGNAPVELRAWNAPMLDGSAVLGSGRRLTPMQRDEERRVYAEAEAAGRAAGAAVAQKELTVRLAELSERARAMQTALDALSRPLAQLDDQLHEQIATLAVRIARSLVRRELRMEPAQIIGIVRDTVALLPASTRGPRVVLNPLDAALVRERVAAAGPEAAWSIVEDPVLARGDCRVHTDHAQIDARLDTRLNEALAALIGEERARERGVES